MNNWNITLINTVQPFDKKEVVIPATTIQEALDIGELENNQYYARSARFHSSMKEYNYGQDVN